MKTRKAKKLAKPKRAQPVGKHLLEVLLRFRSPGLMGFPASIFAWDAVRKEPGPAAPCEV
jgi:hypothetical protein